MAKKIASAGLNIIVALVVLLFGTGYRSAYATPIGGQQLYYQGGSLEITVLPYDASYTNTLYLFSNSAPLRIASNVELGKVVNLPNLAALGIAPGEELRLGVRVENTGNIFLTGPASGNPDNAVHGTVDPEALNSFVIAFEDLTKSDSDFDFNDARFRITGGISLDKPIVTEAILLDVPEPASAILLIFGLAGLGWSGRRNKQHS